MPRTVGDDDLTLTKTVPQSEADRKSAPGTAKFDPLVGATLADRYEIIRRIGEGGMGAVYEARHSIIGKRVAIKVLLEKFLENEELIARLLQEARMASSIGHQNIVDVTDFGTTRDGRAFVVMEFLEGESLSELILDWYFVPIRHYYKPDQIRTYLEGKGFTIENYLAHSGRFNSSSNFIFKARKPS